MAEALNFKSTYRKDIDGLRAIAVISVLIFHANPLLLPGGFIGVDIFFVISGYLITQSILADLQKRSFRVRDFYRRRINRIFPALITVVSATLIFGYYLDGIDEFRSLGKNALFSMLFVANVSFWREIGYFDTDASLKPLLHLWSLGVEEQFYIVWPIVVSIAASNRAKVLWSIVFLLIALSFFASVYSGTQRLSWGFYLPFSRFWELGLGGMLAVYESRRVNLSRIRVIYSLCSGAGLIIIAVCLFKIDELQPYPGYLAAGPVVSALLIISSPSSFVNEKLLSVDFVRGIGLISYPLYLWHWPILAFMRQSTAGPLNALQLLGAAGIILVLSVATYMLIEKPIRYRLASGYRWRIPAFLILSNSFVCLAAGAVVFGNGIPSRLPPFQREFELHPYVFGWDQRLKKCFLDEGAKAGNFPSECWAAYPDKFTKDPVVMLWGDSNAAALYPGLKSLSAEKHFGITQFNMGRCPPLTTYKSSQWPTCEDENIFVLKQIEATKPDMVILSALWMLYYERSPFKQEPGSSFALEVNRTLETLKGIGIKQIVIVDTATQWPRKLSLVSVREQIESFESVSGLPLKYLTQLPFFRLLRVLRAFECGVRRIDAVMIDGIYDTRAI